MNRRNEKLFVYGTLRQGHALHPHLAKMEAQFVGRGWIGGALYSLGEYPGAIYSASARQKVEGEIYDLPRPIQQLRLLDQVEEFDPVRPERSLYLRKRVTVRLEDGRRIRAWAYVLPKRPSNGRKISSGVYAKARHSRQEHSGIK